MRGRRVRRPQPTTDRRSPEERLEAMVRERRQERFERIWRRILDDIDADPKLGVWIAAARTLSERLIISDNAFYYLTEAFLESPALPLPESDLELSRLRAEMVDVERAHDMRDDDGILIDEPPPPEWRALYDAWNRRLDDIKIATLRELGHADVAALRTAPDFEHRLEAGRKEVWQEIDDDEDD